jgi:putative tricarboxylic transport membrane protein
VTPIARNRDVWSGLALAALGTYIVAAARGWTYLGEDGPGPGFFPLWYGSLMVVLSLVLVATAVLRRAPAQAHDATRWNEVRRAFACWAGFVASIALMPWLGFFISYALLTWFLVAVLAARPQRVAIPLALGGAIVFYAIFQWGLDLSLPRGALF